MNSAEEDIEPNSNRIRETYDVMATRANMDRKTTNRRTKEHINSCKTPRAYTRTVEPMMNNQGSSVT